MLKRLVLSSVFALLLVSSACAQSVFVRNHPFKGPMSGRGAELMVGLKEIAALFEVQVQQTTNGYIVGKYDGEPKDGDVWVQNRLVSSVPGEGEPLVNLKEFAEAEGYYFRIEKEFGTIEVNSTGSGPATAAAAPVHSSDNVHVTSMGMGAGKIVDLNLDTPGAPIGSLDAYKERDKFIATLYYRSSDKDPNFGAAKAWANLPDVIMIRIDVGPKSSALSHTSGIIPRLLVEGTTRARKFSWTGGAVGGALSSPVDSLKKVGRK